MGIHLFTVVNCDAQCEKHQFLLRFRRSGEAEDQTNLKSIALSTKTLIKIADSHYLTSIERSVGHRAFGTHVCTCRPTSDPPVTTIKFVDFTTNSPEFAYELLRNNFCSIYISNPPSNSSSDIRGPSKASSSENLWWHVHCQQRYNQPSATMWPKYSYVSASHTGSSVNDEQQVLVKVHCRTSMAWSRTDKVVVVELWRQFHPPHSFKLAWTHSSDSDVINPASWRQLKIPSTRGKG